LDIDVEDGSILTSAKKIKLAAFKHFRNRFKEVDGDFMAAKMDLFNLFP